MTKCHDVVNILRCWHICLCNFLSFVIMPQVNPKARNQKPSKNQWQFNNFVFDRTHSIYVIFQSCGFHDAPRVLIVDASSFQAFTAILDWLTHLASISCWYQSNARQDEFRQYLKPLYCELIQKYEVKTMSVVGAQPKKHTNLSYKATKHIKCTFVISDYY